MVMAPFLYDSDYRFDMTEKLRHMPYRWTLHPLDTTSSVLEVVDVTTNMTTRRAVPNGMPMLTRDRVIHDMRAELLQKRVDRSKTNTATFTADASQLAEKPKNSEKKTKPRSKKMKARTAIIKNQVSILRELKLKFKLLFHHTPTLTKAESGIIINKWEDESRTNEKNTNAMIRVSSQTTTQIQDISEKIDQVNSTLEDAKKLYARTRSDEQKIIIERRIVLAGETRDQLISSQKRLTEVVKRVKETVEDAHLAKLTLDSRTEEARIYRELEGGLKLVGQSLAHARQQHVITKDEHDKFETSMSSLDTKITTRSRASLSKSAQKYLKEKPRKKNEVKQS